MRLGRWDWTPFDGAERGIKQYRTVAPRPHPLPLGGTKKNIIRQDVAPRRMRRERKSESKKDPKLYSKALFRKETANIAGAWAGP